MTKVFQVFVIGPMGEDKDDPAEQATPISQHMSHIDAALRRILPRHIKSPQRFDVYTPNEGGTDIEQFVFNHIDGADLAVADITSRSPSVMYELAYFHALGTPVIILDDAARSVASTPFYLKGANIVRVSDFSVDSLVDRLGDRLRMFFDPDDHQDFSTNPITKFYSAPLVEVSGAAAIARGYFRNLIDPILNAGYGVIQCYPQDKIDRLCVVRPSGSFNVNDDLGRFRGAARRDEKNWGVNFAGGTRTVSAYLIDGVIYDYPRTIGMLSNSPRLMRLTGPSKAGGRVSASKMEEMRSRITERLVDYFFHVLADVTYNYREAIYSQRLEVVSLEDYEQRVRAAAG